jgi:uncharacterized protein YodC (DUF2158 family)
MEEKIFFMPGDIVTLKQDIPNKPIMIVVKKVTSTFRYNAESKEDFFKGIKCRWFTTDGTMQEALYNTHDLIKL